MTEHLVISALGHRGDGIVIGPAGPIYVPRTLPGETVEVEDWPGHPDRRHLLQVEVASRERTEPICPHFGTCGGCALQHWDFASYRAWKRNLVVTALSQHRLDAAVDDLIDAHGEGRRRTVLHARRGTHEVLEVGFTAQRAHHIVAIDRCPVLAPALDGAIKAGWAITEALAPTEKPLDLQFTASETGLDVDLRGSGPLTAEFAATLARLAETHRLARLTRHGELIAQRAAPILTIGRAKVALPPGAFLQATIAGELALAELVGGYTASAKTVADLFCGVGPFALRLAEHARVAAFDNDQAALTALARAAANTAGLKPVIMQMRDLLRRPLLADELKGFEAVVFDPPRQGAAKQARELAASAVPCVVAVSCNIGTLVRDVRILTDGGYRLMQVTPIDQFRYSPHVEIVARLEKAGVGRRGS